jgi:hypothetical protein
VLEKDEGVLGAIILGNSISVVGKVKQRLVFSKSFQRSLGNTCTSSSGGEIIKDETRFKM